MSRKLRIEYPGAMYHVMNRGDQREDIFRDDENRQRLLSTLGEACGKTDWQVQAYCLMRNHFRLVLETPQLESFRWSGYGEHLKSAGQRPGWLRVDRLLGEKGIPKNGEAGRRQFGLHSAPAHGQLDLCFQPAE